MVEWLVDVRIVVDTYSVHPTKPVKKNFTYTSSRIGAALVVEPSLTLIIGEFGYLG